MRLSRTLISIGALALFLGTSCGQALAQGTDHFTVFIPLKGTVSPYIPIGEIKAEVALSADVTSAATAVTFTFKDQLGNSNSIICQPSCAPTGGSTACAAPYTTSICFTDNENLSRGPDIITVTRSFPSLPNDPVRFEIDFLLQSNIQSGNCTNTQQVDPNSYLVSISSANPNKIIGVCLQSFDGMYRPGTLTSCAPSNWTQHEIPIPLDNSNDKVATVDSSTTPDFACYTARPPVDVVMVLDKSGSMSSTAVMAGPTRMDALHTAVSHFVNVWSALPAATGDKIGGIFFDTTSPTSPSIPNFPLALTDMTLPTTGTNVSNWVTLVTPGGSTSIGAGLHQGDQTFVADGSRKVVLLMSDGQQNTDPFVKGDGTLYCTSTSDPLCMSQGLQSCTFATPCPLTNKPQLYTVTVGPSNQVDPAIAQAIATGFYLNTETNYPLLNPFFLELLQNFIRFNSYETVRLISENVTRTIPFSTTIPISSTSHNVVVSLMWPNQLGPLRLTVTPPGGAQPLVKEGSSGLISLVQSVPLAAPYDPRGDWKVLVEEPAVSTAVRASTSGDGIPFDLHLMTDDAGIKTELSVVRGDYKSGDRIRLRAKVADFGLPILGLGSHAGDVMKADLIKPGQSVGDMLSDSTASGIASSGPDPQSAAENKLANTLLNNPSVLKHASDTIQLFDDGKAEHGDDVAGDGIYSALYTATLPGHYNFLFSVESKDPNSIRFSRQQLRTVYVRPVPDAGNTVIQSSILRRDNSNVLSIIMTPRVKPGPGCANTDPKCGRMGPGWANYFWFTTPGQTAFKANDNLDGTYTATLPFVGLTAPPVTVHFENVLAIIGDSVTPSQLPDPLGSGNVLVNVPPPSPPPPPPGTNRVAVFFDGGAAVPHGTFGNAFNTGFSLNAGLEYIATSRFSAEGIFGYHRFTAKVGGGTLNLYQFSANGKAYLTSSGLFRPFINAGIGGYDFTPGGGTHFGGNVGAGVLREFDSHWGVQASYNFHTVNTPVAATKFSTAQIGIRFVF